MSKRARERDHPVPAAAAAAVAAAAADDYEPGLREMNDALLASAVHQKARAERAVRTAAALRRGQKSLRASNEGLGQRVAERTTALTAYQERLRGLVKELVRAEMRERKRLAIELHDNLAQILVLCKMKASSIQAGAPAGSRTAADALAVKQLLGEGIDYTRTLISDLRPDVLNEYDLAAAILWVGRRMRRYGLDVQVEDDGDPKPVEEELVALVFDCVRELLFNVVKHAATGQATVSLRRSGGEVRVTVADEGVGIDPARPVGVRSERGGFGLFSISERLSLLGGRMEIASARGRGTRVLLIVPVHSPREDGPSRRAKHRRRGSPAGRAKRKATA
jgi:signal transduction histidine kinase